MPGLKFVSRSWRLASAALLAAVLSVTPANAKDWSRTVTVSAMKGHVLGNPAAKHRLIVWASYTCPHCAHFDKEAMAVLKARYLAKGHISLEMRNMLRDPLDITAGLLARCGGSGKFFGNHSLFMASQDTWMAKAQGADPSVQKSWYQGSIAERTGRIARAVGFVQMMTGRGVSPAMQKTCLASDASMEAMRAMTLDAVEKVGIRGTPSFAIDGELIEGHDWAALKPRLDALLKGN